MSRSPLNGAAPALGFSDQSGSAKSNAPALHLNPKLCQNMMKSKSNSITLKEFMLKLVCKKFRGKNTFL